MMYTDQGRRFDSLHSLSGYPFDSLHLLSGYPFDSLHSLSGYPFDSLHSLSGYPFDSFHLLSGYPFDSLDERASSDVTVTPRSLRILATHFARHSERAKRVEELPELDPDESGQSRRAGINSRCCCAAGARESTGLTSSA